MSRVAAIGLALLCLGASGCSETRVTRDPAGRLRSGFRYYDPRPIAIVHRIAGTHEIIAVDVEMVPDLRKPRYIAQEVGLGTSGFEVTVTDGLLTKLNTTQTQAPEGFVDKVTTQYKALVEAMLDKENKAIARDEAAAAAAKKKAEDEAAGSSSGVGIAIAGMNLTKLTVDSSQPSLLSKGLANSVLTFTTDADARGMAGFASTPGAPIDAEVKSVLAEYKAFLLACPAGTTGVAQATCAKTAEDLMKHVDRVLALLPILQVYLPTDDPAVNKRNAALAAFADKAEAVLNKVKDLIPVVASRWKAPVPPAGPPPCVCEVSDKPDERAEVLEIYDIVVEQGVARLVRVTDTEFLRDLSTIYRCAPTGCVMPK